MSGQCTQISELDRFDATPAKLLGPVERPVRFAQKVFGVIDLFRPAGQANRQRNRTQILTLIMNRHRTDSRQHPLGPFPGMFTTSPGQHHSEFLAAITTGHIALTEMAFQSRGDGL